MSRRLSRSAPSSQMRSRWCAMPRENGAMASRALEVCLQRRVGDVQVLGEVVDAQRVARADEPAHDDVRPFGAGCRGDAIVASGLRGHRRTGAQAVAETGRLYRCVASGVVDAPHVVPDGAPCDPERLGEGIGRRPVLFTCKLFEECILADLHCAVALPSPRDAQGTSPRPCAWLCLVRRRSPAGCLALLIIRTILSHSYKKRVLPNDGVSAFEETIPRAPRFPGGGTSAPSYRFRQRGTKSV